MSWYTKSFGLDYLEIYSHRDAALGEFEAGRIVEILELGPGARVLDVACGNGRHTLALRRLGLRPVGVDLSYELLRDARRRGSQGGPNDLFVRGDMRRLPVREAFDAAVSLFTSFGYFDDEADDRATLRSIAAAVRPGGGYLLDFLNEAQVRASLVPRSEETKGERRIVQERRIGSDGRRIEKTIRVYRTGEDEPERVFVESVRLYGRNALIALLEEAGFRVASTLGSYEGVPYSPSSPRLILVARKPCR